MLPFFLFGSFIVLALMGVPLFFALLAATTGVVFILHLDLPMNIVFLSLISGVEPYILLAVPLFILVGGLLGRGGMGKRLLRLAIATMGWMPGGYGVSTILTCMMFGGVSGSALADTAAVGSLVIPEMKRKGYGAGFSAILLAVAGTIPLLMPISIPFLVYAYISGVALPNLIIAGIIPAMLLTAALMLVAAWYGLRTGVDPGARTSVREVWAAFKDAFPALLMPGIIVGGIASGKFIPSSAAAVAVVYGLLISIYYYKEIRWADLPSMMLRAFIVSATVLLVIGATDSLGWLMTAEQVATQMANMVNHVAHHQWEFLAMLNVILLMLGILIEPLPAMLLTAPIFMPIAQHYHITLVHLGVIMVANLSIALAHPPVGGTLFISARLADAEMGDIVRNMWGVLGAGIVSVLLITYWPWLTSFLPAMLHR